MTGPETPRDDRLYVGVTEGARRRDPRLLAGVMLHGHQATAAVRLFVGCALVLFGVLWTFENLGFAVASEVLHWWPVVLLVYGLLRLTGQWLPRSTMQGVFFTGMGFLLCVGRLAHLNVGLGILFPLLTILAGVTFVRRSVRGEALVDVTEQSEESIRVNAVMGAANCRGVGSTLRRGDLCAMMGGIVLDLRDATPPDGRLDLEVCAVLGGIEIVVPETWRVESELTPIIGGFDDSTSRTGDAPAECVVRLTGTAFMGGVVARNSPSAPKEVHIVRRRRGFAGETVRELHVTSRGVTMRKGPSDAPAPAPDAPAPPSGPAPGTSAPPPVEPH